MDQFCSDELPPLLRRAEIHRPYVDGPDADLKYTGRGQSALPRVPRSQCGVHFAIESRFYAEATLESLRETRW